MPPVTSNQGCIKVQASVEKQGKEINGIRIVKREIKLPLFLIA
jgi:hypothetical protein